VQGLAVEPALIGLILGFGHLMPEWGLPQFKKQKERLVRLLGGGGMFGAEDESERARGQEREIVEDAGVEVLETLAGEGGDGQEKWGGELPGGGSRRRRRRD
jgi:hypothetical protein